MSASATLPCPESTFPRLSQRDLSPVLSTARRLLGCEHLAHDAVQEALITLSQLETAPDYPIAWLTRAVVHRSHHIRRTARRREHHEHVASQHCHLHGDCDNPLHIAIAHELGERLAAVRNRLPSDQREAIDRFDTLGQTYQEIAAELGVPIGTVRSRISRAREALEASLQDDD